MPFRPLQDRALVVRDDSAEKSKGGIIIPDTVQEKPLRGKVVSVGEGRLLEDGTLIPVCVKEGDIVLFGKHAGVELKLGGEVHLILKETELLCIEE